MTEEEDPSSIDPDPAGLPRRRLMEMAKARGIRANQKTAVLVEELRAAMAADAGEVGIGMVEENVESKEEEKEETPDKKEEEENAAEEQTVHMEEEENAAEDAAEEPSAKDSSGSEAKIEVASVPEEAAAAVVPAIADAGEDEEDEEACRTRGGATATASASAPATASASASASASAPSRRKKVPAWKEASRDFRRRRADPPAAPPSRPRSAGLAGAVRRAEALGAPRCAAVAPARKAAGRREGGGSSGTAPPPPPTTFRARRAGEGMTTMDPSRRNSEHVRRQRERLEAARAGEIRAAAFGRGTARTGSRIPLGDAAGPANAGTRTGTGSAAPGAKPGRQKRDLAKPRRQKDMAITERSRLQTEKFLQRQQVGREKSRQRQEERRNVLLRE